jgi:hypothetical protein
MNPLEIQSGLQGGFFGNILQNILNPEPDNSEQLANELYYKDQELAKAKQQNTISMAIAGGASLAAIFLATKLFKNKKR